MKTHHGFTLIEMLMVVVIIGIVIGIGIPVMNSLTRSAGLQGAIRQFSNTAHLARQFAITHRVRTEVRVTNTWNAVSVFTNDYPVDKWNYLPVGVTFDPSGTAPSITFKPTGDLVSSVDQKIIIREGTYLTNGVGSLIATNKNLGTITVSALLGRVIVQTP